MAGSTTSVGFNAAPPPSLNICKVSIFCSFSLIFFSRNFRCLPKSKPMATCSSSLLVLPNLRWNCCNERLNLKVRAKISGENKKTSSMEPVNNGSVSVFNVQNQKGANEVNRKVKSQKKLVSDEIELLWDDGYGSKSVNDYFAKAKEIVKHDGGPPRWFSSVDCG